MITKTTPSVIVLDGYTREQLERHLVYIDKSVDFEIKKHKRNAYWFSTRYGVEAYEDRLQSLKEKRKCTLAFENDDGVLWTYSGLAPFLARVFNDTVVDNVVYPDTKLVPLDHKFRFQPREHQIKAVEALVEVKHGAIEYATGVGKTLCLSMLLKHYGLKSCITTPSVSIAGQIYSELVYLFGKKYVGKFYGGKKEPKKLFIVAVDDSLVNVEPGTDTWDDLAQVQVVLVDETHTIAADTLSRIFISGPLACAPYRSFVSGTVFRNDGRDLLLEAITGPTVASLTVQEGVARGILARPEFRMVWIDSKVKTSTDDVKKLEQAHIYNNSQVAQIVGDLANKCVELMGRPVVILIDEFIQFTKLLPYLKHDFRFAHGGATKANKGKIPVEYHKPDNDTIVKDFNDRKYPILIGTSCIATGTDIQPVGAILYLRGGKSPIEVAQSVGRGTRVVDGKEDCLFIDFGIRNVEVLERHALARKAIFNSIYPSYEELTL